MSDIDREAVQDMTGPELVGLHNRLRPDKPVRRFATRAAGVERVRRLLPVFRSEGACSRTAPQRPKARRATGASLPAERAFGEETKPPRPGSLRPTPRTSSPVPRARWSQALCSPRAPFRRRG